MAFTGNFSCFRIKDTKCIKSTNTEVKVGNFKISEDTDFKINIQRGIPSI